MDTLLDGAFGGLFDTVDPLGMILRTLLALLADSLSTVITSLYSALFEITTIDLSTAAVRNIWAITTGISASLATILLVIAAFRSMVAQSNRYLLEALPGVVLAILGPQFITAFLPWLAAASTDLAQAIVASATPDLAASMRLLAGVGNNPFYEGLGLMAPVIAAMLLFGMSMVFFVLLFCMAAAVVLYVLSPFAFAGLVMAPTRAWFTKWATGMFAVVFAKVPIAILLALSVSLFANSAHNGTVQSFVNAGAGLILGLGALLSPLLAFGLFSFMGAVATRPAGTQLQARAGPGQRLLRHPDGPRRDQRRQVRRQPTPRSQPDAPPTPPRPDSRAPDPRGHRHRRRPASPRPAPATRGHTSRHPRHPRRRPAACPPRWAAPPAVARPRPLAPAPRVAASRTAAAPATAGAAAGPARSRRDRGCRRCRGSGDSRRGDHRRRRRHGGPQVRTHHQARRDALRRSGRRHRARAARHRPCIPAPPPETDRPPPCTSPVALARESDMTTTVTTDSPTSPARSPAGPGPGS